MPASPFSDYNRSGSGGSSGIASTGSDDGGFLSVGKLQKQYLDYLGTKREEIEEAKEARRYRHGSHYTSKQIEALRKRKQPVVTYNRIGRKIDGVIGLVERLRQDPKAFPRTPQHEQGAELATAVLRFVTEQQRWTEKSPISASDAATEGIGGLEIVLEQGDAGDIDVAFDVVDPDSFFYDPRSFRADFSDARYMGVGKWMDVEHAKELFPDKADALQDTIDGGDLTSDSDRDQKWYSSENSRVRVVDHWYKRNHEWLWCIYAGGTKLAQGKSYLIDEKKRSACKYIMFSASVDHDGDRYGFVRNLKSAQDEINARRSKGLHELNTRRIIAERGAFDDIEEARREAARPDGVVIRNPGTLAEMDDTSKLANLEGQLRFLDEAKAEIENFGPNPALLGNGVDNKSGRAIQLLQQAGIAELGPYILSYRGWKIRFYRALFNAIQQHWTGERWIRVTDDEQVAQFVQLNQLGIDPQTGQPALINAIGSLDVDILLDEGPDTINMMADAYDTLTVLVQQGAAVPPEVLVELSPLTSSVKTRIKAILDQAKQAQSQQIDPVQAKMAEVEQAGKIKLIELEQTGKLKERELDQDFQLAQRKQQNDVQLAAMKSQGERDSAVDQARREGDAKSEGLRREVEPLREIATDLVSSLAQIAGSIKQSIEAPRQVRVVRDQNGFVVGGESVSNL